MFDNHIHTTYSVDSTAKPREIIKQAKNAGLSGLCFTDHWDVGYDSINEEKLIPFEYARCDLQNLRSNGPFGVYCGIEIGPMAHVLDRVRDETAGSFFDFIILSAHYVENTPQVRYDGFFAGREKKDAYDRYLSTLISLVKQYDDFDALGHFDYISRYAPYPDPLMRYGDHEEKFDELFTLLINRDKTLEINTGKHRGPLNELPFDRRVLERYRDLGGTFVCLGSDAHRTVDVGYMFSEFRGLLISCGFTAAVKYVGRKPVFEKI